MWNSTAGWWNDIFGGHGYFETEVWETASDTSSSVSGVENFDGNNRRLVTVNDGENIPQICKGLSKTSNEV